MDDIVKEARPLTNCMRRGPDAVWTLKKEHRLLMVLEDLQIAPRPIEMFQEWEHFYLVESLLDGVILRSFMAARLVPLRVRPSAEDVAQYVQRFCRVYARIAEIVGMLHERNIVFTDLSHYNVMVAGEADDVRLIDFEGAYEQGVDSIANLLDRTISGCWEQGAANLGEVSDHACALRGVVEERTKGCGDVGGGESVLNEFGKDLATGD